MWLQILPPPVEKLRFSEKTLKSAKAGQEASKTAQEPARAQKIAKTLCFTDRNWPPGDALTRRAAEGARPVGGRKRGGQN